MFGPFAKQMYAAFGLSLIAFTAGYNMGLTSLFIPALRAEGSGFNLSLSQESWLISISLPMLWLGLTGLSFLMALIGRKYTVLFSIFPVICANITLTFARNFTALAVGQLFASLGGAGIMIGGYFIGEFSSPRLRGFLLALRCPSIAAGILSAHVFGALSISWRNISLMATAPMILAMVIISSCPESAVWLAANGKFEKCRKSYYWYRGGQERKELEDLILIQGKDVHLKKKKFKNFTEVKRYLLDRTFLKSLAIGIACLFMIDCSGKQIFMSMSVDITSRVLGRNLSSEVIYYVIGMDLADLLTSIVVCFITKRFKRRSVLFIMTPVALISLLIFCLLSFLTSRLIISASYSWVSFLFLIAYFLLQSPTFTIAFTLINEVYPYSHKTIALMFQHAFLCLILFIFLKLTPGWLNEYGTHGTFLIFGLVVISSLLVLFLMTPETSGKTLMDIENEMQGDKVMSSRDREQATQLNVYNDESAET